MAVTITHAEPHDPPVVTAQIANGRTSSYVLVRPMSKDVDPNPGGTQVSSLVRTIECGNPYHIVKCVATLDDIEAFGEALVRLARDGKAAL